MSTLPRVFWNESTQEDERLGLKNGDLRDTVAFETLYLILFIVVVEENEVLFRGEISRTGVR